MESIKNVKGLVLNFQEKFQVHSFHQVCEQLAFGQLFSHFCKGDSSPIGWASDDGNLWCTV